MKIVVTGASGGLGSGVCRLLTEQGHEVIAIDLVDRGDLPVKVHVMNLLDRPAVDRVIVGIDAVAHLGNHTDFIPPDPQMILGENTAMNMNVFQAAINAGAKRIVFASSIQVVASVPRLPGDDPDAPPPPLPMDGDTPAKPTNPYALSKQLAEVMLEYFSKLYGVGCVSVRFPWMAPMERFREVPAKLAGDLRWARRLAFSFMSYLDGARLVAAILNAEKLGAGSGARIYLPASTGNFLNMPAGELIHRFMAGVPLRRPIDQITSVVDISRITAETGWTPRDNQIVS
ncbi:MAG: NAD(P)-dependent oxidoreductase [Planctomycetes bacterium]|nr:NAD(P)-dependent oxidoreductase [Planctomycetota bacterium]